VTLSALSVSTMLPEMLPVVCGANSMPRMQLTAGFSVWPVVAQEVSAPPSVKFGAVLICVIFSKALPRFSTMASCGALTEPTAVPAKVSEYGSATSTLRICSTVRQAHGNVVSRLKNAIGAL
jgi:hypothetical protein